MYTLIRSSLYIIELGKIVFIANIINTHALTKVMKNI